MEATNGPQSGGACAAVVVIGRNEAPRLARALASAAQQCPHVVYVDSGSTDASVAVAREAGVAVIALDASAPYTAARGRNAGFAFVRERWPAVEVVQFLDGDCVLCPGWLAAGARALAARPEVGAVCGRLREERPEASLFHRVAELEWDAPPGETHSFGGIVMLRASLFEALGGFRVDMIAGEDPELSTRVLESGARILRLADEMASHEAGVASASQWWVRQVRTGHSYAELAARHPGAAGAVWRSRVRSILLWGGAVPLAALAGAVWRPAAAALLPLAWLALGVRIAWRERRLRPRGAALYAASCVAAKVPQLLGLARFARDRSQGRRSPLIEYKGPARETRARGKAS